MVAPIDALAVACSQAQRRDSHRRPQVNSPAGASRTHPGHCRVYRSVGRCVAAASPGNATWCVRSSATIVWTSSATIPNRRDWANVSAIAVDLQPHRERGKLLLPILLREAVSARSRSGFRSVAPRAAAGNYHLKATARTASCCCCCYWFCVWCGVWCLWWWC